MSEESGVLIGTSNLHGNTWDGSVILLDRQQVLDELDNDKAGNDDSEPNSENSMLNNDTLKSKAVQRIISNEGGVACADFLGKDSSTIVVAGDRCRIDVHSTGL